MLTKKFLIALWCLMVPIVVFAEDQDTPQIKKGLLLAAPEYSVTSRIPPDDEGVQLVENLSLSSTDWQLLGSARLKSATLDGVAAEGMVLEIVPDVSSTVGRVGTAIWGPIVVPDITGIEDKVILTFRERMALESEYDIARVLVSSDVQRSWFEVSAVSGSTEWRDAAVDLTSLAGQTINIAFAVDQDSSIVFSGWEVCDISLEIIAAGLTTEMTSLNHQNFPFIFMNIAVADDDGGVSDLDVSDFEVYENGTLQTDYFEVLPPETGGGSRIADIVFVLDITGSMGSEIGAVKANMESFINALSAAEIDYGIGLVVYADNNVVMNGGELYYDRTQIINVIRGIYLGMAGLGYGGDYREDGLDALGDAVSKVNFRPGAQKIFIMLTDAASHELPDSRTRFTRTTITELLTSQSVACYPIFSVGASDQRGQYIPIADATGGKYYDIYSNFNSIISDIGIQISNYRVRYRSSDPVANGIERFVDVVVSYDGMTAVASGSYIPGSAPKIQRTAETVALHDRSWAEGTAFTIAAMITDAAAPFTQSATLYYRRSGLATFQSVAMTNMGGNIWQAVVPGAAVETPGLDYYITATDGVTTVSDPSVNPTGLPYQLGILPNEAPLILHTPVTNLSVGSPVVVSTDVIDITNTLASVNLLYRKTGQLIYQSADMLKTTGDTHIAQIPASYSTSDGIDYYIRATDDFDVSSTSGTADDPHHISAESPFAEYLAEKSDLISQITSIDRPIMPDGFYVFAEGQARGFLNAVQADYDAGTASSIDMEAVARLTLSERVAKTAILGGQEVANYGAQGAFAIGFGLLVKTVFDKAAAKVGKVPFIGKKAAEVLKSAANKIQAAIDKFKSAFDFGVMKGAVEYLGSSATPSVDTWLTAEQRISKWTIGLTGITDWIKNIIQDVMYMGLFELWTSPSQSSAVGKAETGSFPPGRFSEADSQVGALHDALVTSNNRAADAGKFVDTIRNWAMWVALVGAFLLIAIGLLAPGGGWVAAVVGIATFMVTWGELAHKTLAITEAGFAFAYVDVAVPALYIGPSVSKAFGPDVSYEVTLASDNTTYTPTVSNYAKPTHYSDILDFFGRYRAQMVTGGTEWCNSGLDSLNYYLDLARQDEDLTIADLQTSADSAFKVIDSMPNMASAYCASSSAREIFAASIEMSALARQFGATNQMILGNAIAALDSLVGTFANGNALRSLIYDSLEQYSIPIPSCVGLGQIRQINYGVYPPEVLVTAEVINFGTEPILGVRLETIFDVSVATMLAGPAGPVDIGPGDTTEISFLLGCNDSLINAAVYCASESSSPDYNILPGRTFTIDLSIGEPTRLVLPTPVYAVMVNPLETADITIALSNLSDYYGVEDVDLSSIRVNETVEPVAVYINDAMPVFRGETVMVVDVSSNEFLKQYLPAWGLVERTALVTGSYSDGKDFRFYIEFTLNGHRAGDLDLSGSVDITDLTIFVNFFFRGETIPEGAIADMDFDGEIGISDLTMLINELFQNE